jgi:hypothetical protein
VLADQLVVLPNTEIPPEPYIIEDVTLSADQLMVASKSAPKLTLTKSNSNLGDFGIKVPLEPNIIEAQGRYVEQSNGTFKLHVQFRTTGYVGYWAEDVKLDGVPENPIPVFNGLHSMAKSDNCEYYSVSIKRYENELKYEVYEEVNELRGYLECIPVTLKDDSPF